MLLRNASMPGPISANLGTAIALAVAIVWSGPAGAQNLLLPWQSDPFTATLSNNTPLVFGMDATAAAQALGTSLSYISGRPGNELLVAIRTDGGSGFFNRRDRLYLQFRRGHLTGWKGDYGSPWIWQ
jgi:hypothetical protein